MFPDKYTRNVTYLQAGWGSNGTVENVNIYIWKYFCSPIKLRLWQMILEIWKIYIWKYFCSPIKLRLWQMIKFGKFTKNILPLFYHSASSTKFREKMFPDKYTRNVTYLQAGWGSNGTVKHLYLKIFLFTHKTSSMTNDSWNLENLHLKIQNILPIFYHSASSTKFCEKMFPDKYTRNVTYLQAGWGSNGTVKHLYLKIFLFTHKTSSMTNDSWNLENLHLKIFLFTHKTSSMTNDSWKFTSENTKYFTNILPLSFINKIPWKNVSR